MMMTPFYENHESTDEDEARTPRWGAFINQNVDYTNPKKFPAPQPPASRSFSFEPLNLQPLVNENGPRFDALRFEMKKQAIQSALSIHYEEKSFSASRASAVKRSATTGSVATTLNPNPRVGIDSVASMISPESSNNYSVASWEKFSLAGETPMVNRPRVDIDSVASMISPAASNIRSVSGPLPWHRPGFWTHLDANPWTSPSNPWQNLQKGNGVEPGRKIIDQFDQQQLLKNQQFFKAVPKEGEESEDEFGDAREGSKDNVGGRSSSGSGGTEGGTSSSGRGTEGREARTAEGTEGLRERGD